MKSKQTSKPHMRLSRKEEALKMPPDGGSCKCGAVGRLQCAFRAQAGNSPLQGQNKPPAKRVVLTVLGILCMEAGLFFRFLFFCFFFLDPFHFFADPFGVDVPRG